MNDDTLRRNEFPWDWEARNELFGIWKNSCDGILHSGKGQSLQNAMDDGDGPFGGR